MPVMIENTLNLSSDNVKDMQAESPEVNPRIASYLLDCVKNALFPAET